MTEIKKDPYIGFDLGGTKMLAVVFDSDFKVIAREKKKNKSQDELGVNIDRIIKIIKTAIENAGAVKPSVIGVGVPGTLDISKGIILEAPNLGRQKIPLKELLEKEFNCPVAIINDVDAGVYGEYKMGAARNSRCVLGVFPGTGIGAGLVYKGEIFTGKNNSCMEIGHFPVVVDGIRCGCGRHGCLETIASRLAISAAAAMAVYRGEAPNLQKITGADLSNIRSGSIAQSIALGDKVIEDIVRQAAQKLGRVLGGVVNLLSPDIILLGGGLVEAMPDLYLQEVESSVKQSVMSSFEKLFRIVAAKLGDDAVAAGAAAWARECNKKAM